MPRLRQPSSWTLNGQSTIVSPFPGTGVVSSRSNALVPALSCSLMIMHSLCCRGYGLRGAKCRTCECREAGGGGFAAASTGGQISSRLLSMRSANALLELPSVSAPSSALLAGDCLPLACWHLMSGLEPRLAKERAFAWLQALQEDKREQRICHLHACFCLSGARRAASWQHRVSTAHGGLGRDASAGGCSHDRSDTVALFGHGIVI